jgi:hypothetical protein
MTMFILASVLLCGGVLLFFFSLLSSWNPKKPYLRNHSGVADVLALVIVTCVFGGAISLFLSFQVQTPSVTDYLVGTALLAVTVALLKMFHVFGKLAAFSREADAARVISGPFSGGKSSGTAPTAYSKAA